MLITLCNLLTELLESPGGGNQYAYSIRGKGRCPMFARISWFQSRMVGLNFGKFLLQPNEPHYNDYPQSRIGFKPMQAFNAVVEHCPDTGLYVGYVPGFPGAHSQGETQEELNGNFKEVIAMILDEGVPQ